MESRWSKAEMWVPCGYLALVLGLQLWVEVVSRTGDIGFGAIWPMLATAPASLLPLVAFGPVPPAPPAEPPSVGALAPDGTPAWGVEPPPVPLPSEGAPMPADWVPDTSVVPEPEMLIMFGYYGALVAGALINASLMWMVLRAVARRRRRGSAGVHGGLSPA